MKLFLGVLLHDGDAVGLFACSHFNVMYQNLTGCVALEEVGQAWAAAPVARSNDPVASILIGRIADARFRGTSGEVFCGAHGAQLIEVGPEAIHLISLRLPNEIPGVAGNRRDAQRCSESKGDGEQQLEPRKANPRIENLPAIDGDATHVKVMVRNQADPGLREHVGRLDRVSDWRRGTGCERLSRVGASGVSRRRLVVR